MGLPKALLKTTGGQERVQKASKKQFSKKKLKRGPKRAQKGLQKYSPNDPKLTQNCPWGTPRSPGGPQKLSRGSFGSILGPKRSQNGFPKALKTPFGEHLGAQHGSQGISGSTKGPKSKVQGPSSKARSPRSTEHRDKGRGKGQAGFAKR